jgi:hypothetical protein
MGVFGMAGFSANWFLYLVITGNFAFMLMLLFVSISEAIRRD